MKQRKKVFALVLALLLLWGSIPAEALAGEEEPQKTTEELRWEKIESLMENIAGSYVDNSSEWVIMDMGAYANSHPETACRTSAEAKQNIINTAIQSIQKDTVTDVDCDKAILALTAAGVDPERLYPINRNTCISAVNTLNGVTQDTGPWNAPYTLAAYNRGTYEGTEEKEQTLLEAVLAAQEDGGSWESWGDRIQATSNMIAGLAFYSEENTDVKTAVEKGIAYLASAQKEDGSFDAYGYGADSNTAAMVVIALAAAGVDPDTDTRFIKGGTSVLEWLLRYATQDAKGFGYSDNTAADAYSTEQGFRALIAAAQVRNTGVPYNVYDFSENTVEPARESGNKGGGKTKAESENTIQVSVTIKADTGYWLRNKSVSVAQEEAVAFDALEKAIEGTGITQKGGENGYLASMTKDGVTLAEFEKGENSGWLYKVNGNLPGVGITSYKITQGDSVLVYYTEDWTRDPSAKKRVKTEKKEEPAGKTADAEGTATVTTDRGEPAKNALTFSDLEGHWAQTPVFAVVEKGWMNGVSQTAFAPDTRLTRGMLVTVLYRIAGCPSVSADATFEDVEKEAWYADAASWAKKEKIVNGDGTSFAPGRDITREQLVTMLYRYAGSPSVEPGAELTGVSAYAEPAMCWAVEQGLIQGYGGDLHAKDGATRGETAAILIRFSGIKAEDPAETSPEKVLEAACRWLMRAVPDPQVGASGGEWSAIGLAGTGYPEAREWLKTYYSNLEAYVKEKNGVLSSRKYTEYSRVILALTAMEKDPSAVAGYNILTPLGDYEKTVLQGINGAIWALIALDSGNYEVSGNTAGATQDARQRYLEDVLNAQLPDGGWSLAAVNGQGTADADLTGMALQALVPYRGQEDEKNAIERGLSCLSKMQKSDGSYSADGTGSAESTAQVLAALCRNQVPLQDPRFVKNGNTVLDGLLLFRDRDGGFSHSGEAEGDRIMATEQAVWALSQMKETD